MPLYFGWTKSQFRSGYNWSKSSILVQKKKNILGLLNPGLNVFPIFEKMFHGISSFKENPIPSVVSFNIFWCEMDESNWLIFYFITKYYRCKSKISPFKYAYFSYGKKITSF